MVILLLGYDGRQEVVLAIRQALRSGQCKPLSEDDLRPHLATGMQPEPDLVIRTSRIRSHEGFLLWQAVRSEFRFHEGLRRFSRREFAAALRDFEARDRRFGA